MAFSTSTSAQARPRTEPWFRTSCFATRTAGVSWTLQFNLARDICARIKSVIAEPNQQPRAIHRVVTSGGSFGASSFQQNIGMGKADRVKTLEIWWPTSGLRQTFQDIPANQAIEIVETQNSYKKLSQ